MQDSSLCETVDVSPRGGVWRRAVQTPSAEVALDDVLTQTKQKKIEKEKQNNRDAVTSSHQSSSRPRSSFSSVTLYREPVRVQTRQPTRARRWMTSTLGSLYRMTKQLKLNSKGKTRRFRLNRSARRDAPAARTSLVASERAECISPPYARGRRVEGIRDCRRDSKVSKASERIKLKKNKGGLALVIPSCATERKHVHRSDRGNRRAGG